ncbi:MAG: type IV secretion system protein, partial [Steroidobacteraceae bacterium]
MPNLKALATLTCLTASIAIAPAARAQWAVIDVGAIAQLIQEVQTMAQQLATARAQLQSAQQTLQAMSGDRGMEKLLAGTQRNYLPTNWTQITSVSQGQATSGYTGLTADVQSAISANAVLSPQQLSTLSPGDQRQIQAARQWSA